MVELFYVLEKFFLNMQIFFIIIIIIIIIIVIRILLYIQRSKNAIVNSYKSTSIA